MSEQNEQTTYKEDIAALLDQYEEGWDIFTGAEDWDHPIHLKGSEDNPAPDSQLDKFAWLDVADKVISIIAHKKYGLDTYRNVLDVIDSEQMIDAYARVGMPTGYDHWSFGKSHIQQEKAYEKGMMGLAYEIVLNTNPSIAYLMSGNTKTMQMLVIAHASYGHNSFFKGNHLFKQFTQADEIVDDLTILREKVIECEDKYGFEAVEQLIDACHALQAQGVNKYTKPKKRSAKEEKERREKIEEFRRLSYDPVLDSGVVRASKDFDDSVLRKELGFLDGGEENILRYVAAYAPHLEEWQRDLVTRISNVGQYFYPQGQTQLMNEGWASFWHYTIMTDLNDMDLIDEGMFLEFLESHSSVLFQPDYDDPRFKQINPYALGFAIFQDIKRICENPTEEDKKWFPDLIGKDWLEEIDYAMRNFKDESFVQQYLSPKVMRDFHLFSIVDNDQEKNIRVSAIHDDEGYEEVREALSGQYNVGNRSPSIEIVQYDYRGDMSLTLEHNVHDRKLLDENNIKEVLKHLHFLWKRPVSINSIDPNGDVVFSAECAKEQNQAARSHIASLHRRSG